LEGFPNPVKKQGMTLSRIIPRYSIVAVGHPRADRSETHGFDAIEMHAEGRLSRYVDIRVGEEFRVDRDDLCMEGDRRKAVIDMLDVCVSL
jgi:hypothetical protein